MAVRHKRVICVCGEKAEGTAQAPTPVPQRQPGRQHPPTKPGQGPAPSRRNPPHSAPHTNHRPHQVIDDDGTDRTPKPLMALNPSVLRGAGLHDKDSDAASDVTSEFFLDRMSDTNFSKAGWMSGTTSGSATPKSDAEEEGQVKAAEGEAAAAPDETEVHAEVHEEEIVVEPELLTERDLDRSVYISLQETPTFFMLSVPCGCWLGRAGLAGGVQQVHQGHQQGRQQGEAGSRLGTAGATAGVQRVQQGRQQGRQRLHQGRQQGRRGCTRGDRGALC